LDNKAWGQINELKKKARNKITHISDMNVGKSGLEKIL